MSDFNFRNTHVYQQSKVFRESILEILENNKIDKIMKDQLGRASLSIILNIAEGYGRFHASDKRSFYVIARGSAFECVACLDIIFCGNIPNDILENAIEISKMLSGLVKAFSS